jgi:hypothetical protein
MPPYLIYGIGIIISIVLLVIILYLYNDRCKVLKRYTMQYGTVEIVNSTCQEGLPHTWSPTLIRMTEADWNSSRRDSILRHERVHLRQRQEPAAWRNFYRSEWGYELTKTLPPGIPQHWLDRIRINPDTADGPWAVWSGRYVFFPTYRDAKRSLRNATVQVWDILEKQIVDPPAQWKQQFCDGGKCPYQFEHPHEIAAEFITHESNSPAAQQLAQSHLIKQ